MRQYLNKLSGNDFTKLSKLSTFAVLYVPSSSLCKTDLSQKAKNHNRPPRFRATTSPSAFNQLSIPPPPQSTRPLCTSITLVPL